MIVCAISNVTHAINRINSNSGCAKAVRKPITTQKWINPLSLGSRWKSNRLLRHLRRWRQNNWKTKSTRYQIDTARLRIRFIVIDMCVCVCATDVHGTFSYSLIYYFYDILMITNGFELPMNDAQLFALCFDFSLSHSLQSSLRRCERRNFYRLIFQIYFIILLNIFFICDSC